MRNLGRVRGSAASAAPLIVGKDTVYVHSNVVKVTEPDGMTGKAPDDLYEYDEIQYGKDEYIRLLSEKNDRLDAELTSTQLALCEIYEGGGE